jgi:hypothetical protein
MENSFFNSNQPGKRRSTFAFILAAALGSCVVSGVRAQVIVVPNAAASNDADSVGRAEEGPGAIHVMELIDASQFTALSGPSFLTQVARRPDTSPGPIGPRTATLRIYASTTKLSPDEMSATFSENTGTNRTLVFDGTVTLSTQNLPGPGDTRQFDIIFPFTTPFLYDPAAGNLLLELQISNSGSALQWDEVTDDPSTRTVLGPGYPTLPTGSFRGSSVKQFTFASSPLVTIRASQMEVRWSSQSNLTYQVQYRSALTTNLWTSLVACIRSTNTTTAIFDPVVLGQPQRFYRVVLTDCVP